MSPLPRENCFMIGLMDNVLQPLLIGTRARLPLLFLFFASVGGLAYFGFIGLFLGPITLAMAMAAFAIYQDEYQDPAGPIEPVHDAPALPTATNTLLMTQ